MTNYVIIRQGDDEAEYANEVEYAEEAYIDS